jgi:outer membrane protein TolC
MIRIFLLIIVTILSFSVNALTKNEFIAKVKKSPEFVKIALQLAISNKQLKISSGAQDWKLGVGVNKLDRTNTDKQFFQTLSKNTNIVSSSLSKDIYETGGDFVISYNQNKNTFDNAANDYDDKYFKMSYTQPLLKNAFGIIDNTNIDLNKFDIQIAKYNVINQQQAFISNQLKQFFNWLKYQQQLNIYQTQLDLAKKLLKRIEKKYKNALVNEVDVLSQKELVLLREQNILNIKQQLFQVRQTLAQNLNDDSLLTQSIDFDLNQIEKITKHTFQENSKTKALKLAVEQQKRNIKSIENEQNANLDLTLSAKNYNKKTTLESEGNSEYEIGLQYSYALGATTADAKLKKAQLALKQQKLSWKVIHNNEMVSVMNLRENLRTLKKLSELAILRLTTAQKKSKQQQKRYELAQIDISLVIDAFNNEQKVQLEKLNYQIQYQNSHNDYLKTLDLLK